MTLRHFYGELVGMLRHEGYEVTLVSSSGSHLDAAMAETGAQSRIIEMSRQVTPLKDMIALLHWHRVVRLVWPSIVVAGTPKCALMAMTASAVWRVPRRVYLCGGLRLEGSSGLLRLVLVWMERFAMAAATEVMVNSSTLKEEVIARRLVSPGKLRQTVPGSTHGVNAQRFAPRQPDLALQARYGIDPDVPVLGFVGRLTHDKGIDTLLEAASSLLLSGVPFHLLVVGPQDEQDSQEYVSRLQSSGIAVSLVGPVEDVRPYYALLSVLVLPSLREGFPNVVLEAAAMGVPTITTTATGCRDSVVDGRTGVLVPPSDANALAAALAEALADADRLRAMGAQAREWVSSEFNPQRIVGGWFYAPLSRSSPSAAVGGVR
ncbi:MAG: glycosyltransferase [Intrasporangium sp.]|uniref:glycosyltransferase n=1 Tax=Intrasporangium sp. TaxID=1925024 RepID=UPI0026488CA6|nr:glycosyltransferase [Intrasporangium sp.]MDN5794745.1 glycosyltransferase [Intrasporangium sp.]